MTEREPDPLFDALRRAVESHEEPYPAFPAVRRRLEAGRLRRRVGALVLALVLLGTGLAWWRAEGPPEAAVLSGPAVAEKTAERAAGGDPGTPQQPEERAVTGRPAPGGEARNDWPGEESTGVAAADNGEPAVNTQPADGPVAGAADGSLAGAADGSVVAPGVAGPTAAVGSDSARTEQAGGEAGRATTTLRAGVAAKKREKVGIVPYGLTGTRARAARRGVAGENGDGGAGGQEAARADAREDVGVREQHVADRDAGRVAGGAGEADRAATAGLMPRVSKLLVELPAGEPRVEAVSRDSVGRPVRAARLSLQIAGGMALTHRRLAGEPNLLRRERAAPAGGVELLAGVRLHDGWRLLVGAGYAAYRQRLNVEVTVHGSQLAPVTRRVRNAQGQTVDVQAWEYVRDTTAVLGRWRLDEALYVRYLTLPVLLEWAPREKEAGRLRPVVGAGPVAHVRLGSRLAAPTDDCGCETSRGGVRPLGLGLNVRAGLDWALRPDLWLTSRVTATTLLTSATEAGWAERRPWRAGVEIGLRYDFQRREP